MPCYTPKAFILACLALIVCVTGSVGFIEPFGAINDKVPQLRLPYAAQSSQLLLHTTAVSDVELYTAGRHLEAARTQSLPCRKSNVSTTAHEIDKRECATTAILESALFGFILLPKAHRESQAWHNQVLDADGFLERTCENAIDVDDKNYVAVAQRVYETVPYQHWHCLEAGLLRHSHEHYDAEQSLEAANLYQQSLEIQVTLGIIGSGNCSKTCDLVIGTDLEYVRIELVLRVDENGAASDQRVRGAQAAAAGDADAAHCGRRDGVARRRLPARPRRDISGQLRAGDAGAVLVAQLAPVHLHTAPSTCRTAICARAANRSG